MTEKIRAMRLAFRVEGDWWVAYLTGDTMADALELARIRMSIVGPDKAAKDAFMSLMSGALARHVEQTTGIKPEMISEPAPEHERSGSA